jgi:copper(I)-binding protein
VRHVPARAIRARADIAAAEARASVAAATGTRRLSTLQLRRGTMKVLFKLVPLVALLCALVVQAGDYELKSLAIAHPFARATPPGATAGGVFLTIRNDGKQADRLLRAASPVAGLVELHEMAMDGGVMKMRALAGIDVKPGATVELAPGGLHVMLEELKRPLKQGERIPLRLTFEHAGTVEIMVDVEAMGAMGHGH